MSLWEYAEEFVYNGNSYTGFLACEQKVSSYIHYYGAAVFFNLTQKKHYLRAKIGEKAEFWFQRCFCGLKRAKHF